MKDPDGYIDFGRYRGKHISNPDIPTKYIIWLAGKPSLKSKTNSFKTVWSCPGKLWVAAIAEAERRGYRLHGDRWLRKDEILMED